MKRHIGRPGLCGRSSELKPMRRDSLAHADACLDCQRIARADDIAFLERPPTVQEYVREDGWRRVALKRKLRRIGIYV